MSTSIFFPRPEAHQMKWRVLMPPLRRAVRELLVRIEGAISKEIESKYVVANCFLVYGERGSGKTTVLLSAKYACEQTDVFFSDDKNDRDADLNSTWASSGALGEKKKDAEDLAQKLRIGAKHSAEKIKDVVWLDMLDMEPLPSCANLLATVLTRVRNALCQSGTGKDVAGFTSILEDGAGRSDSAYQKLSQLISDASLMWEEIKEPDTRTQANRHVDAADKYARYKKQFQSAMETLSAELASRKGSRGDYYRIVLPIDNIDRSTEHLYSIVKLAQMLSSPYLWLVLAGDRQDIETFLERAYWKELIRVGEGAGGVGKEDSGGEDETLVMARRQAAASSHKLLPPSHRVEVEFMTPIETLTFKLKGRRGAKDEEIGSLLKNISVTEECDDKPEIHLIDLFYTENLIKKQVKKIKRNKDDWRQQYLTNTGLLALHLPARGVLNLWRLAYLVGKDENASQKHRAERVARTMLRNSITESAIPNRIGRCLQDKVIRRNCHDGTVLDLTRLDLLLIVGRWDSPDFEFRLNRTIAILQKAEACNVKVDVMSTLCVQNITIINMKLQNWSTKHSQQRSNWNNDDMLPDLVAAWLSVLYDAITWGEENSKVISKKTQAVFPGLINHEYCNSLHPEIKVSKKWPIPVWSSFIENDICGQLWGDFLYFIKNKKLPDLEGKNMVLLDWAGKNACLPQLLATGWVACALQTFALFAPKKIELIDVDILSALKNTILTDALDEPFAQSIARAEIGIMLYAADFYEKIKTNAGPVWRDDDGAIPMLNWLERELPLMWLTQIYVPFAGDSQARTDAVFEILGGTDLALQWQTDWDHIQQQESDMMRKLSRSFSRAER
jgi:hypothetical protein